MKWEYTAAVYIILKCKQSIAQDGSILEQFYDV